MISLNIMSMLKKNLINKIIYLFFTIFIFKDIHSKSLKIEGLDRLSLDDIQSLSQMSIDNNNFDDVSINNFIKNLINSNLFYDVDLIKKKDFFLVKVSENYIIKEIYFNNNIQIKNDDLYNLIFSKKDDFLNKETIRKDESFIKKAYKTIGFKDTIINTKIEILNKSYANLIYEISENLAYKIKYINFYGNKFFSERYLRARVNSKPVKAFNIFTTGSNFNYSLINFDIDKIIRLYKSYGFLDIKVNYNLDKNFSDFDLRFLLEEGNRYSVNGIDLDFPNEDPNLKNKINLLYEKFNKKISNNQNYYNRDLVNTFVDSLNDLLINNNLKNQKYYFDLNISNNNSYVNLIFSLKETQTLIVNKINLYGNSLTKNKTIRSKLKFEPGDTIYDTNIFNETSNLLNTEKYINNSKITYSQSDKSSIDVNIEIDESKKTGNLFLAGGFDGDTGANIQFGISDNNILGTGNSIDTSLSLNTDNILFDVGISQKPLFNPNLKIRYSIFNQENDLTGSFGYKSKKLGFGIGFDADIDQELSNSISFKYLALNNSDPKNSSTPLMANIGNFNKFSINYSIMRNTTNDIFYPKSGVLNKLSFELSPDPLLSDFSYLKVSSNNNFYFKRKNSDSSFFLLSSINFIESLNNTKLNTVDMFSLGGRDFNGFDFRGIGPLDNSQNYLGGKKKYTFKIGYSSSFIFDKKDNILFNNYFNFGSLWDNDYVSSEHKLRSSFTSSLDFLTPIGPLTFSYSIPILKENSDITNNFSFTIGTSF